MKRLGMVFFLLSSFNPLLGATRPIQIVFFGDSLTAGYGVAPEKNYVSLLQAQLNQSSGWRSRVVLLNAGVSGDTTQDGLNRLDWVLSSKPDLVFVALGANDMMRGVPIEKTKSNFKKIIQKIRAKSILPVLIGIKSFPNLGATYTKSFDSLFVQIQKEEKVSLYPFLLKDVASIPELNLPDGIHPNEKGYVIVSKNLFPFVLKQLEDFQKKSSHLKRVGKSQ